MGYVIKANCYRIVDNHSFEMPLPLDFKIYKKDFPIARYLVSAEEQVTYEILTKYKEDMLTTIMRPLHIADIYYLFSCRVFQDRTPFTAFELERLGLQKYNVYDILRRTHGATPFDNYWVMFSDEELTYDEVDTNFRHFMEPIPADQTMAAITSGGKAAAKGSADILPPPEAEKIKEVLAQHRVDASSFKQDEVPLSAAPAAFVPEPSEPSPADRPFENNKMSQNDIEALLQNAGILDEDSPIEITPAPSYAEETNENLTDDDIERLMQNAVPAPVVAPPPVQDNSVMSEDDIARLLAQAAAAPAPAQPEEKPVESMTDDELEQLIESAGKAEIVIPDYPIADSAASSGKMSQADIEAMFASSSAPAEEIPTEPSESAGGKMSQADIEAMFASSSAPAEEIPTEPSESAGRKMSQADIEAMFASSSAPAEEIPVQPAKPSSPKRTTKSTKSAKPAETSEAEQSPEPTGGKMSQAEIEKLLNSMQEEASK